MKGLLAIVAFTILTMLCWGIYGPVLNNGIRDMHNGLRPFICVGLAYFVIAVVVPILLLQTTGEKGHWSATGVFWSLMAGVGTSIGALGIILAIGSRGSPLYIMPLVFGIAPVVNSFTTIHFSRAYKQIGPAFLAGLILVALGAVTVLIAAPRSVQTVKVNQKSDGIEVTTETRRPDGSKDTNTASYASLEEFAKKDPKTHHTYVVSQPLSALEWALVIGFTLLTAVCWGVYGPMLHKGQMAMAGSRLRPFLLVGLSYFLVAVLVPFLLLAVLPSTHALSHGQWTFTGSLWSLAGGAAGAIGALGVIMAFNFGGKPIYVMPLVFGGAPVINTFASMEPGTLGAIGPLFIAGLIVVAAGAVTTLVFAPRAQGHAPAPQATAKAPETEDKHAAKT
jgi:hypothetical protein